MNPEKLEFNIYSGKISALSWGQESAPPVLAVHGWLDNAASFTPIAPLLAAHGLRVIAIDLIGHGLSSHRTRGSYIYLHDYIADLAFIIEQLKVEKITLLGHSLGGAISCLLSGTFISKISNLVLIDSLGPLTLEEKHFPELTAKAIIQYKRLYNKTPPRYKSLDEAIQARLKATPMELSSVKTLLKRGLKQENDILCWRTDTRLLIKPLMMLTEAQVLAYLGNIAAPTCLINPNNGWPFSSELMHNRKLCMQNLTVYDIEGHHHVHMDKPREVSKLILQFLKN